MRFHRRVSDGYLKLAAREPQRWAIIDAYQPPEAVADQVWERVAPLLPADLPKSPGART